MSISRILSLIVYPFCKFINCDIIMEKVVDLHNKDDIIQIVTCNRYERIIFTKVMITVVFDTVNDNFIIKIRPSVVVVSKKVDSDSVVSLHLIILTPHKTSHHFTIVLGVLVHKVEHNILNHNLSVKRIKLSTIDSLTEVYLVHTHTVKVQVLYWCNVQERVVLRSPDRNLHTDLRP